MLISHVFFKIYDLIIYSLFNLNYSKDGKTPGTGKRLVISSVLDHLKSEGWVIMYTHWRN